MSLSGTHLTKWQKPVVYVYEREKEGCGKNIWGSLRHEADTK